ncbi:hypothetical protein DSM104299_00773 [Baekduia alba]|uniref:hypothetical protein n=1 Tax=Baekduia alba TaxID=2997333 RepID=UPI0023425CD9|nr:hypothetical protein [Baekduia alba]WCB92090.1 hypothetical protein DSM104299_00773 [Baekduia alba]
MSTRRVTFPAVAALALACIALGVLAALADGRDTDRTRAAAAARARAHTRVVLLQRAPSARRILSPAVAAPTLVDAGRPCVIKDDKSPAVEPVPDDLTKAFGVLRQAQAADDALPAEALAALRARGLEPFDPAAARLLRTTADGGRAWVVPVRDVKDGLLALTRCVIRAPGSASKPKRRTLVPATPAAPPTRPKHAPPTAVPPATAPQATPPAVTTPTPAPTAPAPAPAAKPHPGLAVVALGGAPAGAGGRLEDLVRGREPVAIDPCGGPNHDMLSVSGIVPDGVPAAFLTSPDGTAIRADVVDNAYAFVVPRAKRPEERYVVWTGGDGTPHVQPLGTAAFVGRIRCSPPATYKPSPVVSPDGSGLCGRFLRIPTPNVLYRAPCVIAAPTVRIAPAPVRPRPRHR